MISKLLADHSISHELIQHPPTYDAQHLAEAVETTGHEVAKTVLLKSNVDFRLGGAAGNLSRQSFGDQAGCTCRRY